MNETNRSAMHYDMVVIGSGAAGHHGAIQAAKLRNWRSSETPLTFDFTQWVSASALWSVEKTLAETSVYVPKSAFQEPVYAQMANSCATGPFHGNVARLRRQFQQAHGTTRRRGKRRPESIIAGWIPMKKYRSPSWENSDFKRRPACYWQNESMAEASSTGFSRKIK